MPSIKNAKVSQTELDFLRKMIRDEVLTNHAFAVMSRSDGNLIKKLVTGELPNKFTPTFAKKLSDTIRDLDQWAVKNGYHGGLNSYAKNSAGKYGVPRPYVQRSPRSGMRYRVLQVPPAAVSPRVKQIVKQQSKKHYAQPTLHTTDSVSNITMERYTEALNESTKAINSSGFNYALVSIVFGVLFTAYIVVSIVQLVAFLTTQN